MRANQRLHRLSALLEDSHGSAKEEGAEVFRKLHCLSSDWVDYVRIELRNVLLQYGLSCPRTLKDH